MSENKRIAILDDNLLFTSTVEETLRRGGYAPKSFPPNEAGLTGAAACEPRVLFVNVAKAGPDPAEMVRRAREIEALNGVPVVAYAGHLETERIQAAREAGADRVVANSAIMADAAGVVRQALGPE